MTQYSKINVIYLLQKWIEACPDRLSSTMPTVGAQV